MLRYLLPFILVLFIGCSTKVASVDYDEEFKTALLSSFALLEKSDASIDDERIKKAIIYEMELKGYMHTSQSSANFHISFESTTQKDVPSNVGVGLGVGTFSRGLGFSLGTARTISSDEENLFIYMIDPATKKRFWQSSLTQNAGDLKSPKERNDYFNKTTTILLKKFPKKQ